MLNLDLPRNRSSSLAPPLSLSITLHPLQQSTEISPHIPSSPPSFYLFLTPSSPPLKSLDPWFLLESDKASALFTLKLSLHSRPSPRYQPRIDLLIPKKTKHQSACHNHSAGGGSAEHPAQLLHVDVETNRAAKGS